MKDAILEKLERDNLKGRLEKRASTHPKFTVGDKVSVYVRLKEGDKERLQAFKGVVISKTPKSGTGPGATFTVRKISEGVGVERVFPLFAPSIDRITVETSSEVRRSRLYYLRSLKGKKARLKEADRFGDLVTAETVAETAAEHSGGATAEAAVEAPVEKAEKSEKKKKEKSKK